MLLWAVWLVSVLLFIALGLKNQVSPKFTLLCKRVHCFTNYLLAPKRSKVIYYDEVLPVSSIFPMETNAAYATTTSSPLPTAPNVAYVIIQQHIRTE